MLLIFTFQAPSGNEAREGGEGLIQASVAISQLAISTIPVLDWQPVEREARLGASPSSQLSASR